MGKAKKFAVIILILGLSLFLSLSAYAQEKVNTFRGNVSIGGAGANGAVVAAFIGSSTSAAKSYTVGSLPDAVGPGRYLFVFECNSGSVAFLKVWEINATWQTCSNYLSNETNLSVSLVAAEGACSYANACSGGFCCSSNTAVNASAGSGTCQSVACGTGITVPSFAINSTSIINTQTVNFTINITNQVNKNVTAANFTLVSLASVVSRNFTIVANGRYLNISYQIFASDDTAIPGTYNVTAVQINDNNSITNRTTLTTLNFTVTSRLTVPNFAINSTSIINTQTVNFTINLSDTYYNISAANFTLVSSASVVSRNFTIPSNSRNLNISYNIFASDDTAIPGTYNVTAVQINDNNSITNRTTLTTLNFTVTSRLTVPNFAINSTSIINTQTVNFTINLSDTYYNISAANFTLVSSASVVSRNFTIPSNSRNLNISYNIFAASETAVPGTYNITAVQVDNNGSITNRTTLTTLNFTVATRLTVPNFALSAASITTAQTVNFTINLSDTYYNITAVNFTLVTGSTVVSRNFTIPSNSKNLNISYQIFASSETATAATYNVTAVQVDDNGSITNRTAITNMNFTVTAVAAAAADTGGGGGAGGGGGGGAAPGAPAAPSEETKAIVKEALPEAFKVAEAAGNVQITTVAAPEVKEVAVAPEAVTKALAKVEAIVKTEEAKQALIAIQQAISTGGASTVSVKKTIEVVKATNKVTKEEVVVSVVKLSVTAPGNQDLKNVEVVEVIPKVIASTVNAVTFKGEKPVVLEADPVVKWFFAQVSKGVTKDMSYVVNSDIRSIGTTTVGAQGRAEAAPAPEVPPPPPVEEKEAAKPDEVKKPTPLNTIVLVVVVIVAAVGAWMFLKSRKKVMK